MRPKPIVLLAALLLIALLTTCTRSHQPELVTDQLKVIPIEQTGAYIHESYLQTDDFGKVACNGLVYVHKNEAIVFDTPPDNDTAELLINWITDSLGATISAVVPTHFHGDCLGGLQAFHDHNILSIAHQKTIEQLVGSEGVKPTIGFENDTTINIGNHSVMVVYPGEGHTVDNVVGYIEEASVLFGGCLIKSDGAGVGFTGDANLASWAQTVENVKGRFKDIRVVVPGHGPAGSELLLDYTINLFNNKQ